MAKAKIKTKRRIKIIMIIYFSLILVLIGRLFYWQVVRGSDMREEAYAQQTKNRKISPKRGIIYDRNGEVLAESITVESISITPKNIKAENKEKTN